MYLRLEKHVVLLEVTVTVHHEDFNDDVIKWKHFPRSWPFVRWIRRSPVNSPHKDHWRGALMFSLICAWTNGCVNNREAGDSRRHCAHYDVIVMSDQKVPNNDGGRAPLWLLVNSVSSAHFQVIPLLWRHNGRDGVSNHRRLNCLLSHLFRRRSKKTSKLRVTGLCEWNSPVTGEFPAQRANNMETVSIWWRHHECLRSWLGTEWDVNCVIQIQRRLHRTPIIIHTIQYSIYIYIFNGHKMTAILQTTWLKEDFGISNKNSIEICAS